MSRKEILIVDDESSIRHMLFFCLERAGFAVRDAANVLAAREQLARRLPSLLLVDWLLPEVSGIEFTRWLRDNRRTSRLPVIMLSARASENDRVCGLESGADDYVTKPFSPGELVSRIRALLRRASGAPSDEPISLSGLTVDPANHTAWVGERRIDLRPTEYRLLEFFMRHPDRAFERDEILDGAWGRDVFVAERTVDVHVLRLRAALEPFSLQFLVQTVRHCGYRFSASRVGADRSAEHANNT